MKIFRFTLQQTGEWERLPPDFSIENSGDMVILRTVAQGLRKNKSAFQAHRIRSGLKSLQKYYRIDRSQIAFLKFIIEAYDGIAVLTTVDPELGIVVLKIAPKCETIVAAVLEDLKKDILIEPVLEPS